MHKKGVTGGGIAAERRELFLTMPPSDLAEEITMDVSDEDLVRRPAAFGIPMALIECVAMMSAGAETALELELADPSWSESVEEGVGARE